VRRLLLPALVLAILPSSACGVLKDDVAATVDGHDITVATVQRLVPDVSTSTPTTIRGVVDANAFRQALDVLVEQRVLQGALDRRHVSVTDEDEPQDYPDSVKRYRGKLLEQAQNNYKMESALVRTGQSDQPPSLADVAAYYDQHRQVFARTCLEVIGVTPDTVDAAKAAIGGGTSMNDYVAAHSTTSTLNDQPTVCLADTALAREPDAQAIVAMAVGQVATLPPTGQFVPVIKVASHDVLGLDAKGVADYVASQIQLERGTAGLASVRRQARVSIDRRYGSWDPTAEAGIAPPPVPMTPPNSVLRAPVG
jgi:hypothetical protein